MTELPAQSVNKARKRFIRRIAALVRDYERGRPGYACMDQVAIELQLLATMTGSPNAKPDQP